MGIAPASGTPSGPEATIPPAEPSATSVAPAQGSSSATSEAAPAASSSDAAVPIKRGAGVLVAAGLAASLLL